MYYEKASALLASDVAVSKDVALQSQVLLTQGLQLFATEQVRTIAQPWCIPPLNVPLLMSYSFFLFIVDFV